MTRSEPQNTAIDADTYEEDYAYYERKKSRRSRKRQRDVLGAIGTIIIIVIVILLLLLLTLPGFREAAKNWLLPYSGPYREYPNWADFTIERDIILTPDDPRYPMNYSVDIPTPEDIGSNETLLQDVKAITPSPSPDRTESKYPDYQWMVWEDGDATTQQTLTIRYSIYTESAAWSVDTAESGTVEDVPKWLADKYGNKTKEEWKILPAHEDIQSLSSQLTAGKVTVYDKLKAIFDHLNNNFEYRTVGYGEPKFCYQTLSDHWGDCDDQSVLFISLARAAGIPSWLEFGALYNHQQETWGGHAWVKVYIPYYSGSGYWYNIDIVNDHFLFRDAYRFSEWESDGNGEHLEEYYISRGINFDYSERYRTISMRVSSDKIKIGENGRPIDESIPGFEGILVLPAIVLTALIMRRRKRIFE